MPLYEYRCVANNHQFDLSQPVGAAPPACPVCGSETRKVYGSVGVIFKGSGFHVTDYRRPASRDGQGDGAAGDRAPSGEKGGSTSGTSSGSPSQS